MHLDTEYGPIESPVSHFLPNLDQSVAFRATSLFTIGWQPVHSFLLMYSVLIRFLYSMFASHGQI